MSRAAVSVVVPFRGDDRAARALRGALEQLALGTGDEVIVADNTPGGLAGPALEGAARIVRAVGEWSSYHARNAGAAVASREWLLFLDADVVPCGDLIDRYFAADVPADCAILAGSVHGQPEQRSLLARYQRDRGFFDGEHGIGASGELEGGAAPTANLMIRRAAFDELGGFAEGIRSAGDFDFCWRAQGAGWRLIRRPEAIVAHAHRERWLSFLGMLARYGAGAAWINRRYPGSSGRWPLVAGLAGSARDIAVNVSRRRLREALYRGIDGVGLVAYNVGYSLPNEVAASAGRRARD